MKAKIKMNTKKEEGKKILKLGNLLYANQYGFLISDLKKNSIQPKWGKAVKKAVLILKKQIPSIHSVYIRGSVATGRAIDNVSDVDFLVVTKKQTRDVYKQRVFCGLEILAREFPFITRFDVGYYTAKDIINIKERALVKLRSVCVYGKDISSKIPTLKPGRDICVTLLGLEKEIEQTLSEIEEGYYTKDNTKAMCTWMMKRLVRGGLELVSERDRVFTRDLYLCFENFSAHYPKYKIYSYEALGLAIYPEDNIPKIKKIIKVYGGFLVKESKKMRII
jgi:uncharacterized protein